MSGQEAALARWGRFADNPPVERNSRVARLVRPGERVPLASPTLPMSCEQLFLSQLAVIDAIVGHVCQRHRLPAAEAEDFGSLVRLKLVENDYEILRKFQQRSSLRTYLTTVIQRLFLDQRIRAWGRWRPSAEARRHGPVGILMDQLMTRDGLTFDQAVETLRTNHGVTATRDELYEVCRQLPPRTSRKPAGEDAMEDLSDQGAAAAEVALSGDRQTLADRARRALNRAIASLAPQDRLILKMRFEDGFQIAEIARALGLDAKPLYRRVEEILKQLRVALEREGVAGSDVMDLLGYRAVELTVAFEGRGNP